MLYMFEKRYRAIWTDGRALPKNPDPRWYGYSVGRWEDDYTFVVETVGLDDRTWLDNSGDPHGTRLACGRAISPRQPEHAGAHCRHHRSEGLYEAVEDAKQIATAIDAAGYRPDGDDPISVGGAGLPAGHFQSDEIAVRNRTYFVIRNLKRRAGILLPG